MNRNLPDKIEQLWQFAFYALAAGITFSNALTEASVATIISLWLIKRIAAKDYKVLNNPVKLILFLFILWNLASFINTSYINESIRGFGKVLKFGLLFLACLDYFNTWKRIERFAVFSLGIGFLVCINGIVQYIMGTDLIRHRTIDPLDYLHRVSSSFVHSNDFGAYLIVILCILLSLFFSRSRRIEERILVGIAALTVAWSLIATASRGAWLGFIVAILFLFSIKSKKVLFIIVALLLISPLFLPASIKHRFSEFSTIGVAKGGSIWERIELWTGTCRMIKEHPILGFGVNTYTRNFPKYKPKEYPDIRYAHNSFLQMASEIGLVGMAIFLIFLFMVIRSAYKATKVLGKGLGRDISLGLLAGIIGFLIHCAVDTHLYSVTLSAFLYLCLGMAASSRKIPYEKNA